MKIGIALLALVLMVRASSGAVVSYNNNITDNHVSAKVDLRAIGSSANSQTSLVSKATSNSTDDDEEESSNPLTNVISCFRADSLFKCFNERVGTLFKVWRETLLNSVRRDLGNNFFAKRPVLGDNLTQLGQSLYKSFANYFRIDDEEDEGRSNTDKPKESNEIGGTRGHHKKKKVHKAITKIILKIIIGIFLLLIKKKMLLHMLQSLVITKFILAALVYLATITFKIWYEIKQAKLHHKEHDKSVIYYENPHEHHHEQSSYETAEHEPEHHEFDDHHPSLWGNLWGRSYAPPTPIPSYTSTAAFQNAFRRPWPNTYLRPKVTPTEEFS